MKLNENQMVVVVKRRGRAIGKTGYMHRESISLAIQEPGRTVQRATRRGGHTPYFIYNSVEWAAHYKSGLNRRDTADYNDFLAGARFLAGLTNESREISFID